MILTVDVEATTYAKGNPFSKRNKLCCVGVYDGTTYRAYPIEYGCEPYGLHLQELRQLLESATLIIGFNIKYDLHWLYRYIPDLSIRSIWDTQLGHFLLTDQLKAYPSLDDCSIYYGLPIKPDAVAEYWAKGIDTPDIPWPELIGRNEHDCTTTHQLYLKQVQELGDKLPLFRLQCADLLVLQSMEQNGLLYNTDLSLQKAKDTGVELDETIAELNQLLGGPPFPNWNSPEQVSAVLYGGTIFYRCRVPKERVLKSGEIKRTEVWGTEQRDYPRLVEPLYGTECIKGWSTAEGVLRSLKANKRTGHIISLILKTSDLDKIKSTYYEGMPRVISSMDWERDTLHGQINQCVAITGRTASSKPNLQNQDGRLKELFYSRYVD